jgi:hypothetical protein
MGITDDFFAAHATDSMTEFKGEWSAACLARICTDCGLRMPFLCRIRRQTVDHGAQITTRKKDFELADGL